MVGTEQAWEASKAKAAQLAQATSEKTKQVMRGVLQYSVRGDYST